jgi:hypothetical protein
MGKRKSKPKKSKKTKTYTKAQKLAKKRIADKKKVTTSTNTGTSGIGPVSSGKQYASSLGDKKVTKTKFSTGTSFTSGLPSYSSLTSTKDAKKTFGSSAKKGPSFKKSVAMSRGSSGGSGTSGIGPVADGAKYASMVSPTIGSSGTLIASHDKPLFGSPPATGPAADVLAGPEFKRLYNVDGGLIKGSSSGLGGRNDPLGIRMDLVSTNPSGLGINPAATAPNYFSVKSPDTYGAPSQADVDAAAGITAGGLNIGGGGFTPTNPSGGSTSRAISDGTLGIGPISDGNQYAQNVMGARPTGNPNVMSANGTFNRPGPGGPEPEADYTSYQPGSFYNLSDTNRMNMTNLLRSGRNLVTTPARMLGINNRLTNMLIPKSNEAIQDARDNRRPVTLTRRGGGGGARLPVAPLTPEEILLPEQVAAAQAAPAYQQAQTGVDPNRLMQIQQRAYAQAFNPYNPLTVGGFNPMFRFFGRRGGMGRGAFRTAFRRD